VRYALADLVSLTGPDVLVRSWSRSSRVGSCDLLRGPVDVLLILVLSGLSLLMGVGIKWWGIVVRINGMYMD
jgi:hypothetical protein